MVGVVRGFIRDVEKVVGQAGKGEKRFVYLNYADERQQVIEGYGAESLKRLREVNRRVDPEALFQEGVPGGYKLFGKSGK